MSGLIRRVSPAVAQVSREMDLEWKRRVTCLFPSGFGCTVAGVTQPRKFKEAVSSYGREVADRFSTGAGEPEDRLRGPLERLIGDLAEMLGFEQIVLAGEERLAEIRVKPDYAVFRAGAQVGFIEVKAPGKGADPNRFRDAHDKRQWDRLSSLPNVLYTDGEEWGLWRNGELAGSLWRFEGSVELSGADLAGPDPGVLALLQSFLDWDPVPPRSPRALALTAARLCRLLRAEVEEILDSNAGMKALAADWRELLFPEADDARFADEYAQTITFALLLARVEEIDFADRNVGRIADQLGQRFGLIGTALDVLTDTRLLRELAVSLRTLVRVFSVVDWKALAKGDADAWLLFYEDFLEEYDPALRRATGSYYTPAPVAREMVRLSDELLVQRIGARRGVADDSVKVVDPACGTGTFLLHVLDRIDATIRREEGGGAVPARIKQSIDRLVGFEIQAGPFAVAELRLVAEAQARGAVLDPDSLRLYVTNTLDDPYAADHHLAAVYEPIARSRREANEVKRDEEVLLVIGNPPYRERSKQQGGWIESGDEGAAKAAPLDDFFPPKDWDLGAHTKHLYNPYVYFWRWASWKVFEGNPGQRGVVALITVAGFLTGPGFAGMRAFLRRECDEIWVIDLSPEGHQPDVGTRVFQGVQQPICITLALRDGSTNPDSPAPVHYRDVHGSRDSKFQELSDIALDDDGWDRASDEWRAEFLPKSSDSWLNTPSLDDVMPWSGSGVMPGRTWVETTLPETLLKRWAKLIEAPEREQAELFVEHKTDRRIDTVLGDALPGYPAQEKSIAEEDGKPLAPVRIGYRSFDRQWLIPDKRLINRPNPSIWWAHSEKQIYLTAPSRESPTSGPSATISALIPDLDHYRGRGGRVYPLWRDAAALSPNVSPGLVASLSSRHGRDCSASEILAYLTAVLSNPYYVRLFAADLAKPGLRVPLTARADLFVRAVELGKRLIWLQSYGTRFVGADSDRPHGPPGMEAEHRPKVVAAIPDTRAGMPTSIEHDGASTLAIGDGRIAPVPLSTWEYEVSGYRVVRRWFGYRQQEPAGQSRSDLDKIVPETWHPEFTTELLELLNVVGLLVELEPCQEALLDEIVAGPLIGIDDLQSDGVLPAPQDSTKPPKVDSAAVSLFDDVS